MDMKRICVYCGSSTGAEPIYEAAAETLGRELAQRKIELVYGGGNVGLMGVVARATIAAGGYVIGIIPNSIYDKEVGNPGVNELYVVKSMHERKQIMAAESDAVLVLPGAYGTLDELFEMLTLVQLQQGLWPIGILNVNGYYEFLIKHIDRMQQEGFLSKANHDLFVVSDNLEELIETLMAQPSGKIQHLERL